MTDWKDVVGTVAPYLSAAIGGPFGTIAETAIAGALGLSDKSQGAIKQALSGATPEQLLAVKVAEQDFALKMQAAGFANARDMEALAAGDRDSARKREMTVQDKTPRNLAYLLTLGFFGVLLFIMLGTISESMRPVLYTMLGVLGSSWQSSISYFFGTTKGSSEKTSLLAKADAIKE